MQTKPHKILLIPGILLLSIVFSTNLFAQSRLDLNTPIKSEIVDGKPTYFTVKLSPNQTAQIEAEQTDADVSLISYNPAGEKLLEWGLPLGRIGSEEIFVIAETAGDYRIEVLPGNTHRNYGAFIIKLTEVRVTTEDDKIKNRAAKEISEMMPEATRLARVDTTSTRRTALGMWEEILRLSKIKADKVAETRALNQIASLFWDLGELQKALDLYVQLVEDWRELKNRRLEIIAAGRIAHIWAEVGEYEKAIAAYIEGRKISREIGSKIEEADSISSIGTSYLLLEQPEKARTYFEQALPMYIEMKIPRLEADTLNFLGKSYFDVGDFGTAIEYFQKGLDLQKKGGEIEEPINSLLYLGKAYKEIGDSEKAFDYFTQASLLANELGNRKLIAQANFHLAHSESERGNLDKAIEISKSV